MPIVEVGRAQRRPPPVELCLMPNQRFSARSVRETVRLAIERLAVARLAIVSCCGRGAAVVLKLASKTLHHDLPFPPLVEAGFFFFNCVSCPAPGLNSEGIRGGRWRGVAKSGSGIRLHAAPGYSGRDA